MQFTLFLQSVKVVILALFVFMIADSFRKVRKNPTIEGMLYIISQTLFFISTLGPLLSAYLFILDDQERYISNILIGIGYSLAVLLFLVVQFFYWKDGMYGKTSNQTKQ